MSIDPHPRAELSAKLDGALQEDERLAVEAHLASCNDCRTRLAELRAVASLIGALPDLAPSRRLVPRVAAAPSWLGPLRTLTTLASGISVFMFIASALLTNMNQLAVPTSGQAAAPAAAAPAAGGASTSERSNLASQSPRSDQLASQAADSAKSAATAAPSGANFSGTGTATSAPQVANAPVDQGALRDASRTVPAPLNLSPWVWLALALVLGAIAIALQRRLRSA